jgi:hypothetical protein
MSWATAVGGALLEALARPRWWLLALGGLLIRGGILVLVAPIAVLPTPAGLSNALSRPLVELAFSGASSALIGLLVVLAAGLLTWIIVGGLAAAATDGELFLEVLEDEEIGVGGARSAESPVEGPGDRGLRLAWRGLGARLLAHIPTAVVAGWGALELVLVTYTELTNPGAPDVPVALRVVARAPGVVAAMVAVWAAGEAAGGLAHRRLALRGGSTARAAAMGWVELARHPRTLLVAILGTVLVLGTLAGIGLMAGVVWEQLRLALEPGTRGPLVLAPLLLLATVWWAGLCIVGLVAAARSTVISVESIRRWAT